MRTPIVIDLETYGLPEAVALLPPPEAPSNYKDPEKIAAYIKDAKAKRLERAALDPDCCRIVALAWQGERLDYRLARDDDDERAALQSFWHDAWDAVLLGFAIYAFDLRVLIRRAQYLGVEIPYRTLDKYRSPHIDLQQLLSFNGPPNDGHTLDFYCRRFGIDVDDVTNGADVAELVTAAEANPEASEALWRAVLDHCTADVKRAAKLAERLGVLPAVAEVL